MRQFIDTNVFVYADDKDAGSKRDRAQQIISELLANGEGVVSTQVLQEFFVNSTRKLGVEPSVARRKVELIATMDLVKIDLDMILGAIDIHRLNLISLWDSLILRAASVAGCGVLLTEDLQHGRVLDGVRIENPFLDLVDP